jgi:hypothetical protein
MNHRRTCFQNDLIASKVPLGGPGGPHSPGSAEHDAPGEDGCLPSVIRRHSVPGLVDEDTSAPGPLATGQFGLGELDDVGAGGEGGAVGRGDGDARAGEGGVGHVGEGGDGANGDRELIKDGHHPGYADLVCEHGEELLVVLRVFFEELLRERLGGASLGVGERLGLEGVAGECGGGGARVEFAGPDGDEGGGRLAAEANGDAGGVDEEVELAPTEEGDPVKPLDAGGDARRVYGTGGQAVGGEGEAAAAGTAEWFLRDPGRSVERDEVDLQDVLELQDSCCRVRDDERAGQMGDCVGDSDVETGRSRYGHC